MPFLFVVEFREVTLSTLFSIAPQLYPVNKIFSLLANSRIVSFDCLLNIKGLLLTKS